MFSKVTMCKLSLAKTPPWMCNDVLYVLLDNLPSFITKKAFISDTYILALKRPCRRWTIQQSCNYWFMSPSPWVRECVWLLVRGRGGCVQVLASLFVSVFVNVYACFWHVLLLSKQTHPYQYLTRTWLSTNVVCISLTDTAFSECIHLTTYIGPASSLSIYPPIHQSIHQSIYSSLLSCYALVTIKTVLHLAKRLTYLK